MIYQVLSVRDSKAAAFALPFFSPRMEVALRSFKDLARDPEREISRHPEDYSLWCLGEYDDNDGTLKPIEPFKIAEALERQVPLTETLRNQLTERANG